VHFSKVSNIFIVGEGKLKPSAEVSGPIEICPCFGADPVYKSIKSKVIKNNLIIWIFVVNKNRMWAI